MHDYRRRVLEPLLDRIRRLLNQALGRSRADKGIGRISAAVLVIAVLSTGLAAYAYLLDALVHDRTTILEAELERRSGLLSSELRGKKQVARALAARMHTARAMKTYQSDRASAVERTEALMTLQRTTSSLIDAGDLRAVELRSLKGDRITSAGFLPQLPALSVPLRGKDVIYWDEGFVLRTSVAVIGEDGIAGEMVADLGVWNADVAVTGTERLGDTGQAAVCGLNGSRKICFPSRWLPAGRISAVAVPAAVPTDRALSGETGTLPIFDYRGHLTYSAFKPLDGLGLAFAVKIDKAELLAPIRKQLMLGIPVLGLLALVGVVLIRRQLRPLTADLVDAKLRADMEVVSRTAAEAEIRLAKRQLQLVADNAPFLIAFLDSNFIFRFANRAHVHWFRRPLDQIIGRPMDAVVGQMLSEEYREAMAASVATGVPQTVFRERVHEDESRFVELTFVAQFGDDGLLEGYCATARDATENVLREQTLLLAARRDPLTGLCNRTSFNERLEHAIQSINPHSSLLTVAYLDIDHFKQVNDRFGHAIGDQLLIDLSERIKAVLKPSDTVARLGGDEIALIMQVASTDELRDVGYRLLERIREPFLIDGHRIHASASIGFCVAVPGDTMSTLLKQADMALYEAKASGRNGMSEAIVRQSPEYHLG